jgi:N-carbamoylputrescine amidase
VSAGAVGVVSTVGLAVESSVTVMPAPVVSAAGTGREPAPLQPESTASQTSAAAGSLTASDSFDEAMAPSFPLGVGPGAGSGPDVIYSNITSRGATSGEPRHPLLPPAAQLIFNAMTSAPSRPVTLGLVQQGSDLDPAENMRRTVQGVREAAGRGAQIVCTQELFRSRYFCQVEDHRFFDLAEPIPGPSTEELAALAAELGVVIVASLFEKRAEGLYHNTAAVIDADGRYLGKYRKMHIPDDPQYYEKFYFTPGDLGFRSWDTRFGRIGVLVCWDQWYPEAARLTALSGAQILFYPTAIGWLPEEKAEHGAQQQAAWETIQRSHAIANGVYVCAVNRVGYEGPEAGGASDGRGIEFWGGSFVADPGGRLLVKGGTGPEVLTATVDLAKVDVSRTHWPFLRDRRIDAYQDITRRYLD